MSRKTGRLLTATLAAGLALSLGSAAIAAPVGGLKQFKVPTANSEPRAITNGSDGNVWFTEGTGNTNEPAKIARITPAGAITEFAANCDFCVLTDIVQDAGDDILYLTANDPSLFRFDLSDQTFLEPIPMPDGGVRGGELAAHDGDIWITDFNSDSLWRYDITAGTFTQFPVGPRQPSDVAVDLTGDVWFTDSVENSVNRLDPATGTVQSFPVPDGLSPRGIAIATDGQIWFTSRFTPQGVGRLDPTTGVVTTFPTPSNPGPQDIAASPDGSLWFTQTTKGNIARIDNSGVITEAKTVRNSGPFGIVVAPNNDPWYTMMDANKVATLQLR